MDTTIIEPIFTENELHSCSKLYHDVVKEHKECNGQGIRLKPNRKTVFEYCSCIWIFDYIKALIYAKIPKRHWSVDAFNLKKNTKTNKESVEIIKDFYDNKSGKFIIVYGDQLSGKSRALSFFGKLGILDGMSVCYALADDIIQLVKNKDRIEDFESIYLERLRGSDIILIDDVDKIPKYEWASSIIEKFIKVAINNGQSIIVSGVSSETVDAVNLLSLIQMCKEINLQFIDECRVLDIFNYFEKPFINEAEKYERLYRSGIESIGDNDGGDH